MFFSVIAIKLSFQSMTQNILSNTIINTCNPMNIHRRWPTADQLWVSECDQLWVTDDDKYLVCQVSRYIKQVVCTFLKLNKYRCPMLEDIFV